MDEPYYPDLSPLKSGLAGKCPRCGRGNLFSGYLSVAPSCANCGLSFDFADAGDGAAWFVMLVSGAAATQRSSSSFAGSPPTGFMLLLLWPLRLSFRFCFCVP
jgi:uncharacterized protein (DUF983 family)